MDLEEYNKLKEKIVSLTDSKIEEIYEKDNELNENDIRFLYDVNAFTKYYSEKIKEKIREIIEKRDIKKDLFLLFPNIKEGQIITNKDILIDILNNLSDDLYLGVLNGHRAIENPYLVYYGPKIEKTEINARRRGILSSIRMIEPI